MTRKKKPAKQVLAELYDSGISMRLDKSGNLLARHVEDDGLTDAEVATIREYKHEFKKLLVFDERSVRTLIHRMLKVVYEKIDQDGRETTANYVDHRIEGWEEELNEAIFEKDMGRTRWAARKYVEEAFMSIKGIHRVDDMAKETV